MAALLAMFAVAASFLSAKTKQVLAARRSLPLLLLSLWYSARSLSRDPVPSQESRTIYFDFNKSVLVPSGQQKLDTLAKILAEAQDVQSVDIVGDADLIGKSARTLNCPKNVPRL
jgi:outer membrane protein OmpA-like peptidoglycan-associated protein